MVMARQIPLTSTTAEDNIAGDERLVNVYPRRSAAGRYPFTLVSAPGFVKFSDTGGTEIKALHVAMGRLFAFDERRIYEIFASGQVEEHTDQVLLQGTRLSVANNGSQMVVVDGIRGYSFALESNELTDITNSDGFYPATTVTYQDGYFIFNRDGTGQFFISELLASTFDPLDFATAEANPDDIVALISDHRELFLFGTDSISVWYNSGAADFPFERNQGAFIEKGCAAPYSVAKQNNTLYFVGSDRMVYQMAGYQPARISNHAVEQTLRNAELSDAFAWTYHSEGHLFYLLTVPDQNVTWAYDITTGSWHIRESSTFGRHIASSSAFYDNRTVIGDFQSGNVYELSDLVYDDNGDHLLREFILPTVGNNREFLKVAALELDMTTGVGIVEGQGDDPIARLEYSIDNGRTWSNQKFANIGKLGEYQSRVKWRRLGTGRQFTFKVSITDPVYVDVGGAFVEAY